MSSAPRRWLRLASDDVASIGDRRARHRAAGAGLTVAAPSRAHGSTVARLLTPTFARPRLASPAGAWRVEAATSWSHQPQVMLVLDAATHDGREWVQVLLAKHPNGSTGWIPRDRVVLRRNRYWIDVRKRARQVTVYRDGRPLRRLPVLGGTASCR
jgi:hypothetical protein